MGDMGPVGSGFHAWYRPSASTWGGGGQAAPWFGGTLRMAGARRGFLCISAVAAVALMCTLVAVAGTIPVPKSSLTQPGSLKYCSDISSAPGEFYGPGHVAQGVDIDVGNDIAKRLGLKAVWVNTAFAGI